MGCGFRLSFEESMPTKTAKDVIPFADYCRIFRVIFTVLDGRANTHSACIFFAMAGAAILRKHNNLVLCRLAGQRRTRLALTMQSLRPSATPKQRTHGYAGLFPLLG